MLATKKSTIFADMTGERIEEGTLFVCEYRGLGNICWTNRPEEEVLMDFFEKNEAVARDGAETLYSGASKVVAKTTKWVIHTPSDNHWGDEITILRKKGVEALVAHLKKEWDPEDQADLREMIAEVKTLSNGGILTGAPKKEHMFIAPMTKRDFLECTTGEGKVRKEGRFTTIFHTIGGDRSIEIPDHLESGWNVFAHAIN